MANYDAIGAVSQAFVDTLRDHIVEREGVVSLTGSEIALTSPDEVGSDSDTRLSVYLYEVTRTDRQHGRTITENNVRKGSPLPLELHYLLTAYPSQAGTDETANSRDQHSVLGLAMQVLNDNWQLESLGASFQDDPTPEISMQTDAEDTVSRIWDSFRDVPLYPSVTYTVEPVLLDSLREEEIQRVSERDANIERSDLPGNDERGDSTE